MQLLKNHYLSNKNPGSLKISSNTSLIKEKSIIEYLKNTDNPDYFDPYRLEFYVYEKMFHHIDKGRLCCNDSISYKDFDLDLIPEENIEKSLEIAEKFGYYKIRNYCDQRLDEALDELDKAWLCCMNRILAIMPLSPKLGLCNAHRNWFANLKHFV